MKLSTEAKAGVMVAVSFLGLGGVLVGKKYLDPDNPITALASETGEQGAKEPNKENEGDPTKKGEKTDPKNEKSEADKKENGTIILAKGEGQVPAFSPGGDPQGKPGMPEALVKENASPPPFSPFPMGLETNNSIPPAAGANKEQGKTGTSGLPVNSGNSVKKDEIVPFSLPSTANAGSEKKSTSASLPSSLPGSGANGSGTSANPFPVNPSLAGSGPGLGSPPPPAPLPSGSPFPLTGNDAAAKGSELNKSRLATNPASGPSLDKKAENPFPPTVGLGAGLGAATGAGAGLAGAGNGSPPGPLPAPSFPGSASNSGPAFPQLDKTGTGALEGSKKGLNDLPLGGTPLPLAGTEPNGSQRNQANPRGEMPASFRPNTGPATGSSMGGSPADNTLANRSGASNLGGSSLGGGQPGAGAYGTRDFGISGGYRSMDNTGGAAGLGNSRGTSGIGNAPEMVAAPRPSTKPTVTTFSALTGPAKRTEFIPLEENSEPLLGRAAGSKESTNAFPATSGQNFPGAIDTKAPPPATFPLPQGSARDPVPVNTSPGTGPGSTLPPLGRADSFPAGSNFSPGTNSANNTASPGARPEPFPLGMPPANPNGPVLRMPADDQGKTGNVVQPAGFQYPSGAGQAGAAQGNGAPQGNGSALPGASNLAGGSSNAPFNPSGFAPSGGNLPSPGALPGGSSAPSAFPGSVTPPAPGAFPVTATPSSPGPFPGSVPAPAPGAFPGTGSPQPGGAGGGSGAGLGPTAPLNMNAAVTPKVSAWSEKVYSTAAGDTWDSIAQREYQRKELGRLLQTYNDIHPRAEALPKTGPLPARTEVYLPPAEELIKRGTGEVPMNMFPPGRP